MRKPTHQKKKTILTNLACLTWRRRRRWRVKGFVHILCTRILSSRLIHNNPLFFLFQNHLLVLSWKLQWVTNQLVVAAHLPSNPFTTFQCYALNALRDCELTNYTMSSCGVLAVEYMSMNTLSLTMTSWYGPELVEIMTEWFTVQHTRDCRLRLASLLNSCAHHWMSSNVTPNRSLETHLFIKHFILTTTYSFTFQYIYIRWWEVLVVVEAEYPKNTHILHINPKPSEDTREQNLPRITWVS